MKNTLKRPLRSLLMVGAVVALSCGGVASAHAEELPVEPGPESMEVDTLSAPEETVQVTQPRAAAAAVPLSAPVDDFPLEPGPVEPAPDAPVTPVTPVDPGTPIIPAVPVPPSDTVAPTFPVDTGEGGSSEGVSPEILPALGDGESWYAQPQLVSPSTPQLALTGGPSLGLLLGGGGLAVVAGGAFLLTRKIQGKRAEALTASETDEVL